MPVPSRALALVLLVPALAACAPPTPAPDPAPAAIADAESLVRAMHARYAGRWYRTLSFKQTVARTNPDGSAAPREVWTEFAEVPGRLRIDLGDGYTGNGLIYANDSLYVFRRGARVRATPGRNPLQILGFDVYAQPPEQTLRHLREEKFDLSRFHASTWQGRPAYVVGAAAGDLASPQFWVDAERLVFVRLLQPSPQDPSRIHEIRFDAYRPLAGGWIAPVVLFLRDGREYMREDYFDMQADVSHAPGTFDPSAWGTR